MGWDSHKKQKFDRFGMSAEDLAHHNNMIAGSRALLRAIAQTYTDRVPLGYFIRG